MPILARAIKPKDLNVPAMRVELLAGLRRVGAGMVKDFEATTRTWTGAKPKFSFRLSLAQPGPRGMGSATVLAGPEPGGEGAQKYGWVSEGTKPHTIMAGIYTGKSNKRALAFPGTFRAKTAPGVLSSTPGARGGPTRFAAMVDHPGTRARRFDRAVANKWRKSFAAEMRAALERGAAASGHARR